MLNGVLCSCGSQCNTESEAAGLHTVSMSSSLCSVLVNSPLLDPASSDSCIPNMFVPLEYSSSVRPLELFAVVPGGQWVPSQEPSEFREARSLRGAKLSDFAS